MNTLQISGLLLSCFFISCGINSNTLVPSQEKFPESHTGHWKGDLEIIQNRQVTHKIIMTLDIGRQSKDTFDWIITYDDGITKDIRAYSLVVINKDKGQYIIDENNGILLKAQMSNNDLTSVFSVMNNLLRVSYRISTEEIDFSIDVVNVEPQEITGDSIIGNDTIPPVYIYPLLSVQTAKLKRTNGY
jgi:hypothetical protein